MVNESRSERKFVQLKIICMNKYVGEMLYISECVCVCVSALYEESAKFFPK